MDSQKRFSDVERDQIRQALISLGGEPGALMEDALDFLDASDMTLEQIFEMATENKHAFAVATAILRSLPPEDVENLRKEVKQARAEVAQGGSFSIEALVAQLGTPL
ncbi:MAG: hypothetical protein NTU97_03355 [Candidatus Magasanikbacteria bacterium]|nr:hypothetical protein [Candidatus Magasanikbacteria bacterium]